MTRPSRSHTAAFTAVEILVSLALAGLVIASVVGVLVTQRRFYTLYFARIEAWDAVAAGAEILASELRGLSPAAGDLYALAGDSVALRSVVGFAYVCGLEDGGAAWLLRGVVGSLETRPRDSVLVFHEGEPARADDDRWLVVHLDRVEPVTTTACPGGRAAERRAHLSDPVPGLRPGAPLHAFRPYVYRVYRDRSGRPWLGRRLRGDPIQPVVGPMEPPPRGLSLRALEPDGRPAGAPGSATWVRFALRARVPLGRHAVAESAAAAAFLRNGHP